MDATKVEVGRTYLFDPFPGASDVLWPGPQGARAEVLETGLTWRVGSEVRHTGVRVRYGDGTEQIVNPLGLHEESSDG